MLALVDEVAKAVFLRYLRKKYMGKTTVQCNLRQYGIIRMTATERASARIIGRWLP